MQQMHVASLCQSQHPWFRPAAADGDSDDGLLKDVTFYALDSRQETILWDVKPAFVVVYDPDVTFVRQLEVWSLAAMARCL